MGSKGYTQIAFSPGADLATLGKDGRMFKDQLGNRFVLVSRIAGVKKHTGHEAAAADAASPCIHPAQRTDRRQRSAK
jgi:hypothetical protein